MPEHPIYSGALLIVGSARGVWDDLRDLHVGDYTVMAVNDMIMHYPYVLTHAYSNDWHMLPNWLSARRPEYRRLDTQVFAHSGRSGSKGMIGWPWPCHGTSSLNAVYTGLALGYDSIVLAGIPLDNSGHYFNPDWIRTNFDAEVPSRDGELRYWARAAKTIFDGKVKSLSGRTRELLGVP